MLTEQEAKKIVEEKLPGGRIETVVSYQNLYLFQVFIDDDPLEGYLDPFYSVDKETGYFRDFSILEDGKMSEIVALFQDAKKGS